MKKLFTTAIFGFIFILGATEANATGFDKSTPSIYQCLDESGNVVSIGSTCRRSQEGSCIANLCSSTRA